jgi:hypothetical protein
VRESGVEVGWIFLDSQMVRARIFALEIKRTLAPMDFVGEQLDEKVAERSALVLCELLPGFVEITWQSDADHVVSLFRIFAKFCVARCKSV